MKQPSFAGLLYREFYIAKKQVISVTVASVGIALFCILVLLSFQYGNLRFLEDNIKELVHSGALAYGLYLPAIVFCMISECILEVNIKMEDEKWRRFRLSTPVTGIRFALVKYAFLLLLSLLSIGLCSIYFGVYSLLFSCSIAVGTWGILFLIIVSLNFVGTIMQIYGLLLHSIDKAGVATALTIFPPLMIGSFLYGRSSENNFEGNAVLSLEKIGAKALPYSVIALLLLYVVGFVIIGLLYQRREK